MTIAAIKAPTTEDIADHGWHPFAACRDDPDFTVDAEHGRVNEVRAQKRHICIAHCPVIRQCLADAREYGPSGTVAGGLLWESWGRMGPQKVQPLDPGCGSWCAGHRGVVPLGVSSPVEAVVSARKRRTARPRNTDDRVANVLAARRAELKWTLDTASRAAGVGRGTISRMERGEISPMVSTLGKICEAYGLKLYEVLTP